MITKSRYIAQDKDDDFGLKLILIVLASMALGLLAMAAKNVSGSPGEGGFSSLGERGSPERTAETELARLGPRGGPRGSVPDYR